MDAAHSAPLTPGTQVEVRSRFDASWVDGFAIERATDNGYELRRFSDGQTLPATFPDTDVRPAALEP